MRRFLHSHILPAAIHAQARDDTVQRCLWALWTIAVGFTAYWTWHTAVLAGHLFSTVGMAIHCGTVGIIGMIVLTLIEMKLQPERFLD